MSVGGSPDAADHEGDGPPDGLRVRVADLLRSVGGRMTVERSVRLPDVRVVTSHVRDDEPVEVDLVLDSLTDGLVASGTVSVPWEGECRRCLRPVSGRSTHEVKEVFTRTQEGDTYLLTGDEVDLGPMVRDAAALGLPLAPLCEEGCRGPSPESFPAHPPGEVEPPVDERWAALDDLEFDDD